MFILNEIILILNIKSIGRHRNKQDQLGICVHNFTEWSKY